MKLIINANSIYDRVIRIGRQTENLVSEITFNMNMWIEEYGAGECVLNVRRNGDGSAYPVPMTITDGLATWTITDTDTARKGRGEIQLVYRAGDKVKTSPIFTISCGESLVGDGEPPTGYDDWLAELNRMTAQVEAAKTSASASAQTAQTAAETATTKATEAEQSANTASGFANNASALATSASTSAQAAAQSAEQAASSVSDVAASAQAASQSAQSAESAKQAAQTAEASAQGFAQTASQKASEAAESAANAAESVTDAQAEADRAKTYADRAAEVELEIPTKVSELENDAGYLTEHQSLNDYVQKDVLYNMLPVDTASGTVASFTDGADNVPLKSLVVGINPIQDLHGYDSPWPAGGGKNLFDKDSIANNKILTWQNGSLANENGSWVSDFIPIENDTTYFNNYPMSQVLIYDEDKNGLYSWRYGEWSELGRSGTIKEKGIFVTPSNGKYLRFSCRKVDGITENLNVFQLEKGSAETDYAPYTNICPISGWTGMTINANGTEITISWESEAGTVYGGTLDVVSGALTVTKGFIQSYSGETLPSVWISDRDVYADVATPTTGAEVCYTLAEPVTYQLTPHEIKSLLGQNNIYANTGDTSVEYRADIQQYVEDNAGAVTAESIANALGYTPAQHDFTAAYQAKVDALWTDYQSAMAALGIGGE